MNGPSPVVARHCALYGYTVHASILTQNWQPNIKLALSTTIVVLLGMGEKKHSTGIFKLSYANTSCFAVATSESNMYNCCSVRVCLCGRGKRRASRWRLIQRCKDRRDGRVGGAGSRAACDALCSIQSQPQARRPRRTERAAMPMFEEEEIRKKDPHV